MNYISPVQLTVASAHFSKCDNDTRDFSAEGENQIARLGPNSRTVCYPFNKRCCSGEVWIGGEKAPVTQATCLRLKADTVLTSALWQALSWQDAGSNRFLSRSVRRQTAARLSQEKAVVKPPTLAKRTQWKRLQSLLHISCPAVLSKSRSMASNFFGSSR